MGDTQYIRISINFLLTFEDLPTALQGIQTYLDADPQLMVLVCPGDEPPTLEEAGQAATLLYEYVNKDRVEWDLY